VDKPQTTLAAATDPGAVARGHRVATVSGCAGCHGDGLRGQLFEDEPGLLKAWGPNLTLVAAKASDADLDRAIRHGVGADGRRLWIMPSNAFAHLTDQESADLIAYIRSFAAGGEVQPRFKLAPMARLGVLLGKFHSEPDTIAADARLMLADAGPAHARGRDMARACVECHGAELKGGGFTGAPDLTIAAAYDDADFERLMRTGVAAGNRKVGLMSEIAPDRFNSWSSEEIAALHGYLKARAQQQIAQAPNHASGASR
jgi:mono/diheme cytochrome c family protein